jgi:polar amino acid transport system substrate-binding protein
MLGSPVNWTNEDKPMAGFSCARQAIALALLAACMMTDAAAAAGRTYRVGVQAGDYYPIMAAKPPELRFEGYARDVLDLFAASENIQFQYVALPARRTFNEFWSDRLDFAFPDNPRWSVDDKKGLSISYTKPVVTFQDAIYVVAAHGNDRNGMKSLGMLLGWTPWKFEAEIAAGKLQVHTAPSPESLLKMTMAGRIDGANLAEQVANYHLKREGLVGALVPNRRLMPIADSHYYLSSIRYPELIESFNQFLERDKTKLQKLRLHYGL